MEEQSCFLEFLTVVVFVDSYLKVLLKDAVALNFMFCCCRRLRFLTSSRPTGFHWVLLAFRALDSGCSFLVFLAFFDRGQIVVCLKAGWCSADWIPRSGWTWFSKSCLGSVCWELQIYCKETESIQLLSILSIITICWDRISLTVFLPL